MLYVGIDPGVTGAVSVIDCTYLESGEIECHDTPIYHDGKRTRINSADCGALLRDLKRESGGKLAVFIEKSQPMPKNGSIACFGLGYSFGVWIGILAALEIPYTLVTPQAWKKALMPGEPKEKDSSRVVARRLWPAQTEEWLSRKKDHGRADALLIAEYGRRIIFRT